MPYSCLATFSGIHWFSMKFWVHGRRHWRAQAGPLKSLDELRRSTLDKHRASRTADLTRHAAPLGVLRRIEHATRNTAAAPLRAQRSAYRFEKLGEWPWLKNHGRSPNSLFWFFRFSAPCCVLQVRFRGRFGVKLWVKSEGSDPAFLAQVTSLTHFPHLFKPKRSLP